MRIRNGVAQPIQRHRLELIALCVLGVISTIYVYQDAVPSSLLRKSLMMGNPSSGVAQPSQGHRKTLAHAVMDRILRRKREPRPVRKRLSWVIGYPHSGNDELITMAEYATGSSMATNDGSVMQDTMTDALWYKKYDTEILQPEWYKRGPFKNNAARPVSSENILVKIKCTGTCLKSEGCTRIQYIRDLANDRRFGMTCKRHHHYAAARGGDGVYTNRKLFSMKRVEKIIVTMRSPMEMVTARYRTLVGEAATPAGLVDWCHAIDSEYGKIKDVKTMMRRKYLPYVESVPCYTEFLRMMIFYDQIFQVKAPKDNMTVYWEDYIHNLGPTVIGALNYAGIKDIKGDIPFDVVGSMDHWFPPEYVPKIGEFMEAAGKQKNKRAWPYFQHYFSPHAPVNIPNQLDVGQPIFPGGLIQTEYSKYEISASGSGIWNDDSFHFFQKAWQGDVTLKVRIMDLKNTDEWTKGGLMVRESLHAQSPHAMCSFVQHKGPYAQMWSPFHVYNTYERYNLPDPIWLMLKKHGPRITCWYSYDGAHWSRRGEILPLPMSQESFHIGIALTSKNEALAQMSFEKMTLSLVADRYGLHNPIEGTHLVTVDVGHPATFGTSEHMGKDFYRLASSGSGIEIGGVDGDQFTANARHWMNNVNIKARVDSISGGKGGLMINDNFKSDAANAFCYSTPDGIPGFSVRHQAEEATVLVGEAEDPILPDTPVWLKLIKRGNLVSCWFSNATVSYDWKQVGDELEVPMHGETYYAGSAIGGATAEEPVVDMYYWKLHIW